MANLLIALLLLVIAALLSLILREIRDGFDDLIEALTEPDESAGEGAARRREREVVQ